MGGFNNKLGLGSCQVNHKIVVVPDTALPLAHDWALIETADDVMFVVKESAMTPDNYAAGWAAYRMLDRVPRREERPPGDGILLQLPRVS